MQEMIKLWLLFLTKLGVNLDYWNQLTTKEECLKLLQGWNTAIIQQNKAIRRKNKIIKSLRLRIDVMQQQRLTHERLISKLLRGNK